MSLRELGMTLIEFIIKFFHIGVLSHAKEILVNGMLIGSSTVKKIISAVSKFDG